MTRATPTARQTRMDTPPAMTPAAFLRQMTKLVRARRAADAAALYARHGVSVAPRLSEWDREALAALMEYVDTVIGWTPLAGGWRADGEGGEGGEGGETIGADDRPRDGASQANGCPGSLGAPPSQKRP